MEKTIIQTKRRLKEENVFTSRSKLANKKISIFAF